MKYIFLLVAKENSEPTFGSDEWKEYAAEYGKFNEQAEKAGVLKGGEPVQPPKQATTVRVSNGKVTLHEGPFAKLKEQILGYYVFECENLDEATSWAAKVPVVARGIGAVEIRPVVTF